MTPCKKNITFAIIILFTFFNELAFAGGVGLGATRVIYPLGDKQVSLPITNSDDNTTFLIQSWVSDVNGKKNTDFLITPPLFVIQPKKENILRIVHIGSGNATDRESVYYLNVKAIPSANKKNQQGNTLQIATQSVIKVFLRPKELADKSFEAPKKLRCVFDNNTLVFTNPSSYYVSLIQLHIGSYKLENLMIPPKSEKKVILSNKVSGSVTFQTVNDYGANTQKQTCSA